jgi:hypothetical protein
MENLDVIDAEEQLFPIRVSEEGDIVLELAFNGNLFHLMGIEGYVIFADKTHIAKADDNNYYVKQDEDVITFNKEEYDMICKAVDICKGV